MYLYVYTLYNYFNVHVLRQKSLQIKLYKIVISPFALYG
jgi:hypothetical protein